MKAYRSFLLIIDGVFTLIIASIGLLWVFNIIEVTKFIWLADKIKSLGIWGYIGSVTIGGTLIILNILYALIRILTRYDKYLRVNVPEGEVSVSVSCVEEALKHTLRSLPEVENAWVHIYKEKGNTKPIRLNINFSMWEDVDGKEAAKKIKEAARYRLSHIIDLTQEPIFNITLVQIVSKEERQKSYAKHEKTKATKTAVEFRGPVYPVDIDTDN